jgi:hypothetical protein
MKKSQAESTTAKNLEERFDRGDDVLDYFDAKKAGVIDPSFKRSTAKPEFAYPTKGPSKRPAACHAEAERRRVVREKPAKYRSKS